MGLRKKNGRASISVFPLLFIALAISAFLVAATASKQAPTTAKPADSPQTGSATPSPLEPPVAHKVPQLSVNGQHVHVPISGETKKELSQNGGQTSVRINASSNASTDATSQSITHIQISSSQTGSSTEVRYRW